MEVHSLAVSVEPTETATFEEHESEVRLYCRKFPVVFTEARGAWAYSEDGGAYLDFFCGAGALNYGHNPADMKARLLQYVSRDGIAHGLDMHTTAKRAFLERRGLPHKVQFCGPTGTGAVEAALKLARLATGRQNVVAFTGAFHGMSRGSLLVTGSRRARAAGSVPLHDVLFAPFEDGPAGAFDSVGYLERLLADPASGIDLPAAVVVEAVQVDGGVYAASADWLRRLRAFTEAHGIVLICDEIQAGCGRTGPFFSFEPAGIVPDLITVSKSISGYGLPLSLLLIAPELDVWDPGDHTGTFRGNQLAFVTGAAGLERWTQPEFLEHVAARSAQLGELAERAGLVVRGRGMLAGLDTGDAGRADAIQRHCFDNGLLLELCGRNDEVVKVMPPLTIGEEELERGLSILVDAIEAT
jgi:diaminobutyrate-2-oxoglutarate transaminase